MAQAGHRSRIPSSLSRQAGSKPSAGAAKSLFPPTPRSLMSRARPFCRASSMVMATWRIFMESFISIWELPPAPISSSTRMAHGPWRKNRAPTWEKFAGRGFGCQAGRSAASAPGTMHSAREPPATTSSSQRRKRYAKRCSEKRNSDARSSRSMSFFLWTW